MPKLKDFDFLAWISRAMFFRDDLLGQLRGLGISDDVAAMFAYSDAVRKGNVVTLYQDYGQHEPEAFELFIQDCWAKYQVACASVLKSNQDHRS
jgi:hypothetical protein